MIRAALLLLCLALAACDRKGVSGGDEPFTDSRLPPSLEHRFWPPAGWAWGLIELEGNPALRYGVAAPQGEAVADVIILPGHGESAELWFETARALVGRGYAVWILDGAGEGGSGSYGARDTADAPDFEADIRGLMALDRRVIRPGGDVAVIASGTAALTALTAAQRGYRPTALILSGPFEPGPDKAWKRSDDGGDLTPRRQALSAWAVANPDLRMGGYTARWFKARGRLAQAALAPAALSLIRTKVTVIAPNASALPCDRIHGCRERVLPTSETYTFAQDRERDPWLVAIFEALPR